MTHIVLVGSKYPRNIGMVSRILSNFALERLILVAPRCDHRAFEAHQGAAEGQTPLLQATVYQDWQEFYRHEKEGPRIAFSRREGKKRQSNTIEELHTQKLIDWENPCYLIFGSEDQGLSNDDLKSVHRLCHFDLPGEVRSMNLSHAVLFAVKTFHDLKAPIGHITKMSSQPITDPEKMLRLWLETLNFDLETHTKWNALTVLQQMVLKSMPTDKELHILDSLIHQTVRKLSDASVSTTPQ